MRGDRRAESMERGLGASSVFGVRPHEDVQIARRPEDAVGRQRMGAHDDEVDAPRHELGEEVTGVLIESGLVRHSAPPPETTAGHHWPR